MNNENDYLEMSNLRKINKDRLTAFLKHLENKNKDETHEKCVVSSYLKKFKLSIFFMYTYLQ